MITYLEEMWQLAMQGRTEGIWFWVAVYVFSLCIYSLIFQIRTRSWPFIKGELVESNVEKFGRDPILSNQDYIATALYKYVVSGVAYEGSRISPWIFVSSHNARFVLEKQLSSIERFSDGRVKVFYNPHNPKKSYLITAGKTGICITLLICVLPIISFYIKYHLQVS